MILQVSSDSESWLRIKHALREAGLKYFIQDQMFGPEKTIHVEPRGPDPEGGKLTRGFIVYEGGCEVGTSDIQEVYDQETEAARYIFPEKSAAKSTTNVASASTVCATCGCRVGPGQTNTKNCGCRCHGTDRIAS